jgi:transcriptional activator HAC1
MDSSPQIKFEDSPAESLADSFPSTPGTHYPSLFDGPIDVDDMTPPSFDDDSMFDHSMAGTPAPDNKKPVKKRKSWGQQLPEPKTNLPPRKRAKTEDEKEQRRVERVLRNRRAAQSSRERKRQEVEALEAEKRTIERRYQDLEMRLADSEAKNFALQQQIAQFTGKIPVFNPSSSPQTRPVEQFRQAPSPLTLSQELFTSQDSHNRAFEQPIVENTSNHLNPQTVNPASLSPEMRPVAESSNASSSDMTQHPAAVLCDLQCQSEEQRPWMNLMQPSNSILPITAFLLLISAATSTILSPLSRIMNSLRMGSSLSPTASILNTIIWLTTTSSPLMPLTSTTSSTTTTKTRSMRNPKLSLRMNLLRRLLACSPQLARPLMDATMGAMRSASEQQLLARDCFSGSETSRNPSQVEGPSIECLMTLLWATKVIDRELQQDQSSEEIGTASAVKQASWELDRLFRARPVGKKSVRSARQAKKSLEGRWSLAFEHEDDH